ncbi:MAG: ABC transporter ATP-binding protein [Chloroflexota bacterium]
MNLAVEGVSFRYPSGVLALDNVNLSIGAGEAVAIVGENGAGKTTLARHFNGLLRPQAGVVRVGDWQTRDKTVAQLARRVGYVFQNPDDQLFARSVREEVAFGPRNLGWGEPGANEAVAAALSLAGLTHAADDHPYDLPVHERKFVAIAATLAMQTPVVILDEPTTGLDAAGLSRVAAIIEALKQRQVTVVTITHDLDFCGEHFQRLIVMSQGRIIADGPSEEVLRQVDVLRTAQVRPPMLISLALALGMPQAPCTVEEFIDAYRGHLGSWSDRSC